MEQASSLESFNCFSCDRAFRWREEIAGRTLRCPCGAKVRCPEIQDETLTASESLDDTVADVELEDAFDNIYEPDVGDAPDDEPMLVAHRAYKGVFGLSLGGEVILYAVGSIIGGACTILALVTVVWRHHDFWPYVLVALLVGPMSWVRLANRWKLWANGRTWFECLSDLFGDADEQPG